MRTSPGRGAGNCYTTCSVSIQLQLRTRLWSRKHPRKGVQSHKHDRDWIKGSSNMLVPREYSQAQGRRDQQVAPYALFCLFQCHSWRELTVGLVETLAQLGNSWGRTHGRFFKHHRSYRYQHFTVLLHLFPRPDLVEHYSSSDTAKGDYYINDHIIK